MRRQPCLPTRVNLPALAACLCGAVVSGCVIQVEETPEPITIELKNSTPLDVRPNLHVSGTATSEAELFVEANLVTRLTERPFPEIRAGETATLTFACNNVESVGVSGSVVFNATSLALQVSEDVIFLRFGSGLSCGNRIRFVFFREAGEFRVRLERP